MVGTLSVQSLEMPAIVRQNRPAQSVSADQDIGIGRCLPTIFLRRQHIMTKPAQFLYHGQREVLVGIQPHPGSLHRPFFAFLVLPDGVLHFFGISGSVLPGGVQVRSGQ